MAIMLKLQKVGVEARLMFSAVTLLDAYGYEETLILLRELQKEYKQIVLPEHEQFIDISIQSLKDLETFIRNNFEVTHAEAVPKFGFSSN